MSKKFTLSLLFLVSAEVIYNISSYVINAGLGRILGPAEYGRYSIVIGVTTMMIILIGRGIPTAMAKRISEHREQWAKIHAIKKTAATLQVVVISSLTLLFFLAAPLIARLFGDPSLTPLFRLSSLIIPAFALSSFHVLYFNGLKAFRAMTTLKISRGIFRMVWILGLAYLFFIHGAIWGAALAPFTVAFIAIIIDRYFLVRPDAEDLVGTAPHPWRDLMAYASGFMLFLFFYEFYVRTDIYLIKAILHDDAATGLYNAAMTVSLIPYYAIFALTFILFPTISELVKARDFAKIRGLLRSVYILVGTILPIAVAVIYFFNAQLITWFFGPAFHDATPLLTLMLGGTVFGTLFYILASVLNGAGYTHITAGITFVAIVASVLLNFSLLPLYGTHATAMIFSGTSTFMGLAALFAVHYLFREKNEHSIAAL